ncbi:MAG TPA: amidohydrolase family protein, partial [Opitutaceae bacterium]|nr:amidohydrolase family protein [Opitutaceae bacterium]
LVAQAVGAGRILYGSDYPLRLYPKHQAEPEFARFLAEIRGCGLGADELAAVLGGNWQRLRGEVGEESPSSSGGRAGRARG